MHAQGVWPLRRDRANLEAVGGRSCAETTAGDWLRFNTALYPTLASPKKLDVQRWW
jgi:hypothetical protein